MKSTKVIQICYWILILTLVIYFTNAFGMGWLETQTYLKQHGTLTGRPNLCYPLPPFLIHLLMLVIIGIPLLWIWSLKAKVQAQKKLVTAECIGLALLSITFILPILFFDIQILQQMADTLVVYWNAQPIIAQ